MSKVGICNMALSHLGVGKEIANLETEKSDEASAFRRFYDIARDATLRETAWPFATKIDVLSLVKEDPNDEWDFSYRYPIDCEYFRRILSGIRNDNKSTRIPYEIASDTLGSLIYTDKKNATAEYTVNIDNPILYPPDFSMALSYYLAALTAARLTAGDPFKLKDWCMKMFYLEISRAASRAFNEEQVESPPESEFITGRE